MTIVADFYAFAFQVRKVPGRILKAAGQILADLKTFSKSSKINMTCNYTNPEVLHTRLSYVLIY